MQDSRDAGLEGFRTGGMKKRTGLMQDMCDAGQDGSRKVGMKGRRDEERRYEEKGGIHHKIGTR